ncbi:MAG: adenylate kinase, partial [Bacteroidales bacterium]|nr:adenylate kinase [Bacteroidales bacterium]
GKGTQSDKIIHTYNLMHLSTGDLLRTEIATNSELGKRAKSFIDKGELVPDEIAITMIRSKINSYKDVKGFIFDGFPRTVEQAQELDKILEKEKIPLSGMIALNVEREELLKRLAERAKVSGRSDDASLGIIKNRIDIYIKTTFPVMDFYKAQGKLQLISGIGSIEEIFERIKQAIDKIK